MPHSVAVWAWLVGRGWWSLVGSGEAGAAVYALNACGSDFGRDVFHNRDGGLSPTFGVDKVGSIEERCAAFVGVEGQGGLQFALDVPLGTEFGKLIVYLAGHGEAGFGGWVAGRGAHVRHAVAQYRDKFVAVPLDHVDDTVLAFAGCGIGGVDAGRQLGVGRGSDGDEVERVA